MTSSLPRVAAIVLAAHAASLAAVAGDGARPLPEREGFLREVRARLRSDGAILRRYSYRRTVVERERDEQRNVVSSRSKVWEVRPIADDPEGFRFLVARDGRPEPASVVAAHDSEYRRRVDRLRRAAETSPTERARLQAIASETEREERETIADIVALYEMTPVGWDCAGGTPCVRVTFAARPSAAPRTRAGRILQNVRGDACVSDQEFEVLRLEAEVVEPIRYGWGILARVAPGATATIERQKTNGGDWLPVRYDYSGRARVLMVTSVAKDATVSFSDFRPAALP